MYFILKNQEKYLVDSSSTWNDGFIYRIMNLREKNKHLSINTEKWCKMKKAGMGVHKTDT